VIRNNEHMKKQGLREIDFLRTIREADSAGAHHCIDLCEHFWHRNHLCLVFEAMRFDLRRLLQSMQTSYSGLSLTAVHAYTTQLLSALRLLRSLQIVHADIKPDNVLVSADWCTVKLCDFGSSFRSDECEITATLGSRFYRAPEIMIGLAWNTEVDVWSLACTLFEIYSTHFLFRGDSNNEMLAAVFALCGAPPTSTRRNDATNVSYRKGAFWSQHFNERGEFLKVKFDAVAQFEIQIPHRLNAARARDHVQQALMARLTNDSSVQLDANEKVKLNQFANLLTKMLCLNLSKRITPTQALKHPFCNGNWSTPTTTTPTM